MKPWRELCVPHPDVLEGTFQQSEFAADITAVRHGRATHEYQDPAAFYQRTFITEGMGMLLTQVALRLNGKGGEPVVQLQTAFGGGKTHTVLAVYHLTTRNCPLSQLTGIPALLDRAGLMNVPKARTAVIDGNAHAPGQPWKHEDTEIRTLWGELAWQLGADDGLDMVRQADATGTSPGKETLRCLLERYAPCVVLVDELVAYVRQFPDGEMLTGGSYDSNMSFLQALTEAAKLVPTAMVLASLPESDVEAGSSRGVSALRAIEKTFGRVQALWKPVAAEEAFEIVRRRIFEQILDTSARDAVCREFVNAYAIEGAALPSEANEAPYFERLVNAYPIHPEVFDRLYQDWSTLHGFQRTRGILKLMARVVFRLWKDQNADLMIMPASLPLYDSGTRNELVYNLPPGWDAVIETDIDGARSEAAELDRLEPRLGALHAARRVARTIFLGSAPSSAGTTRNTSRGIDRGRVLIGCVQPGKPSTPFSNALNRLMYCLHYVNSTGETNDKSTRFWLDTRANLRREMEDRKGRFDDQTEVFPKLASVIRDMASGCEYVDALHVFTPHGDVPDDTMMRMVVLPPVVGYARKDKYPVFDVIYEFMRLNGAKPRYRANQLLFLVPDKTCISILLDNVRIALAWQSIMDDIHEGRLNVDRLQEGQAKKEADVTERVLPVGVRDCYQYLLCPGASVDDPGVVSMEVHQTQTHGTYLYEITRIIKNADLAILEWAPELLSDQLGRFYWKDGVNEVLASTVAEDFQKYPYLPRMRSPEVFIHTVLEGSKKRTCFGTATGKVGDTYENFGFGVPVTEFTDTLLLINPDVAAAYADMLARDAMESDEDYVSSWNPDGSVLTVGDRGGRPQRPEGDPPKRVKLFFGSADIHPGTAKMELISVADEIIAPMVLDPNAKVKVTVEISAEFPRPVADNLRRTVYENAKTLKFKNYSWE
ncbi:MAG: DUF499 domain-containing protein [Polyangiaceae bacterium]|nr:DUF499 domain-containing protein [Polyangiaceae bacterium]